MGNAATQVKQELQHFADRGIFSHFSVRESGRGRPTEFQFQWLAGAPSRLKLYEDKRLLEIHKVLPGVPFRSEMDIAFRKFLTARSNKSVPKHRRLDKKFTPRCRNRSSAMSVELTFKNGEGRAATKTAINILHEIFNNFLMEGPYQNYMVEVFGIAEE